MAEKAAHFSFTSEAKPSIFEVLAQKSLDATLHPALQRLAEFVSECTPKYFGWLNRFYEEAFLVTNGLLQYYYIKNYDASFAEYFYGLRRTSVGNAPLSVRDRRLAFLLIVLLPYLKRKLDEKLAVYRIQHAEGTLKEDVNGSVKKLLLHANSTFELCWGSWVLVNYLRYMADETGTQVPSLWILRQKLAFAGETEELPGFWGALFNGKLSLKEMSVGLLENGLRTSLEIGAFFIQFLQAWNAERSTYNVTALPTVPPPQQEQRASNYKDKCPICLQSWKIPTVLQVSGYVFCFPCIIKHLRDHQRCPVTNIPARPLDIVRLYDSG